MTREQEEQRDTIKKCIVTLGLLHGLIALIEDADFSDEAAVRFAGGLLLISPEDFGKDATRRSKKLFAAVRALQEQFKVR